VILDISTPDALDLTRRLRADSPAIRILAFAVQEDDLSVILDCAEAGADAYVTVGSSVAELVEAIERTAAGELLCSPRIAAQLLRRAAHSSNRGADEPFGAMLTSRERQVFALVRQGHSNKEIATALSIAESTVKNHVHHLLDKLHVPTRALAAARASSALKAL
jgi:DNA-binding NarL/FixJ family response regulator